MFIIIYGLLCYTTVRLLNDVISETRFWLRPIQTNLAEIAGVVIISFIFEFITNCFIIRVNSGPEKQPGAGSALRQYLSLAIYLEIIVVCFIFPLAEFTDDGLQWYDVIILSFTPVSFWLFYFGVKQGQQHLHTTYRQRLLLEQINKDRLENELQYLRAQFHPHFLFNALNTLYFQIDESNSSARYTLEKLSDLLRYQLYDQDTRVRLEQELNHLNNFIELQKLRVSDQLKLELSWPDHQQQLLIYPLLILPLVENAFKYVGGPQPFIRISIRYENNCLSIEVINSIPEMAGSHNKGGIGLTNLQKRLNLLYPDKHKFQTEKTNAHYKAGLKVCI